MIAPSPDKTRVVGMILVEPGRSRRGLPLDHDRAFGSTTVLGATVDRLKQCHELDGVAIVHPQDTEPPRVEGVAFHATNQPLDDVVHQCNVAGRKFTPNAWRGGLGGATIFDELIAPVAMVEALNAVGARSALVVGPDWPVVDAGLCDRVIERHRESPETYRLTFTQAAPGLCGCVIERSLLQELADNGGTIGGALDYNPRKPQADPIARDVCIQIDPEVRAADVRATFDAPRWADALAEIEPDAEAPAVARSLRPHDALPQQVTMEITAARANTGPITPQHYFDPGRDAMALDVAQHIFEQLADQPDTAVMFGGLGDALLHPQWERLVAMARQAGVWGLGLETDLRVDAETLGRLVECPLDCIVVHLNADDPQTYARLMGDDAHTTVLDNVQWLLANRRGGLPWIVPRMIKTTDNVAELEGFVDRWTHVCGAAVVAGPPEGAGVMPDLAVLDMAPPRRMACRQLAHRMTLLSDGRAARCDQDWTGEHGVGDVTDTPLPDLWRRVQQIHAAHHEQRFDGPCANCRQWHRP